MLSPVVRNLPLRAGMEVGRGEIRYIGEIFAKICPTGNVLWTDTLL
jgi:hypothetical protein